MVTQQLPQHRAGDALDHVVVVEEDAAVGIVVPYAKRGHLRRLRSGQQGFGGGLVRESAGRLELTSPLSALAVPSSLQASLVARLDRLEAVKSVAQIGAAIGREFGRDLLAEVAQLTPQQLDESLDRLVDAGLVLRRGQASVKSYLFKHALVQDAVYGTLLRARRLQLHGLIAQAIEHRSPDIAATQPEVLARHLAEAGWSERVADAYVRAGQLALSRSAHREAVSHLHQGLEQLDRVPDSRERDRLEVAIQASLGVALNSTLGYASTEALAAFERARQLMGPLDDSAQAQSIFAGLYVTYWNRAAFAHALEVAEEFLARVSEKQKPQDLCIAHCRLACRHDRPPEGRLSGGQFANPIGRFGSK